MAGAITGALIEAVGYIAELVAKYGLRKAFNHFNAWDFAGKLLKGAAAGAIGGGIVDKLSKAAELGKVAKKVLAGHMAPAAYLVSNFGDFGRASFTENQILALFGDKAGFLWSTAKPYIEKIYKVYK